MGAIADGIKNVWDEIGVRHLVSVANGEAAPLYFACRDDPAYTVIDACREGEAVAISAGLYLGGARPVCSMENLGLFESLDTLRALPIDMGIPLVLLIGYTGRPGRGSREALEQRLGGSAGQADLAGRWTEPFLELAGIPRYVIEQADEADRVAGALTHAEARRGPVAVLVEST
jgi:sulfopyruvate decarboxylase TPP-binding subunit